MANDHAKHHLYSELQFPYFQDGGGARQNFENGLSDGENSIEYEWQRKGH